MGIGSGFCLMRNTGREEDPAATCQWLRKTEELEELKKETTGMV